LGISIDVNADPLNILGPIVWTALPIIKDCNDGQLENNSFSNVVTPLPIVTERNEEHDLNAAAPILVTELGISIDVNPETLNAAKPILVTELGITTDCNAGHELNAPTPILVTELGIITDVNAEHSLNTRSPIRLTELGIVTWIKLFVPGNLFSSGNVSGIEVIIAL